MIILLGLRCYKNSLLELVITQYTNMVCIKTGTSRKLCYIYKCVFYCLASAQYWYDIWQPWLTWIYTKVTSYITFSCSPGRTVCDSLPTAMGLCTSTGQRRNSDTVCIQTTCLTDTRGSHHLQELCSIRAPQVQEGTCGYESVVACRSHIPCSSQSKSNVSDTVGMANVEAFYPCLFEPA
jgi:hypothetical protein